MSSPGGPMPALSVRFAFVSVLPTVMLIGWFGFLFGTDALTGPPNIERLLAGLAKANVAHIAVAGMLSVALGSVLHPIQLPLVRVLEGYWDGVPGLRRVQYLGIELQRRRKRQLRRTGRPERYKFYPIRDADLLPTRLGNALRAAERRAGAPFGMDAVTMFPRIYRLASPAVLAMLDDWRDQLDVAVRHCVVLALITVSGLVVFATDEWWLLLPAVTAILSWASYRAAVRNALNYGLGLRLLFELYHGHLVRALGWEVPKDLAKLRTLAARLETWLELPEPDEDNPPPDGYVGPEAADPEAAGSTSVAST